MTIRKEATNIIVTVKNEHSSFSGFLMKRADQLNIEATKNNLSLICNKKIQAIGKEKNKSQLASAITQVVLAVEKVKVPRKVIIGKELVLKVKKYNRKAKKEEKKNVKWAVDIDGTIENLNETGHEIRIIAKDAWKNKNIIALAYISNVNSEGRSEAIVTITYFKQFPELTGISKQAHNQCVTTTMEYLNKEFGGNNTYNDYLNYYRRNLAANDAVEVLINGVPLGRMEPLSNACFNVLGNNRGIIDDINQGYPQICAIDLGNGNGHCIAIIGYTSNSCLMIMDPEKSSVSPDEAINLYRKFLLRITISGYISI